MNALTQTGGANTDLRPTPETYGPLAALYDEANWALFGGRLPRPLITLQRHGKSMGYLKLAKYENTTQTKADELTLNPTYLKDSATLDVLVIMVHLMLHVWQSYFGNPGRGGYHNREFAIKAKKIGLNPSDTGEPGGKETGERISHYVVEDGCFHLLVQEMEARGVGLNWAEVEDKDTPDRSIDGDEGVEGGETKSGKKYRYICPEPHFDEEGNQSIVKLWGKEGLEIACIKHGIPLIIG